VKRSFTPTGTCSRKIEYEIDDAGVITACRFSRGCSGNLQALSRLVVNRPAGEVVALLEGIQCQNGTSCPDQLARALREHLANQDK
jgi:uncharacterized protein (TIGR03905 family)